MSLQCLYLQVILFIIYYINVYILSIKYIQYKICIIYYYICYIFLEVLRDNLVVICGVYVPVCLCPGECSVLCHTTGSERHEFVPGRDRVRISSAKAAHRDRDKPQWTKPLAELSFVLWVLLGTAVSSSRDGCCPASQALGCVHAVWILICTFKGFHKKIKPYTHRERVGRNNYSNK